MSRQARRIAFFLTVIGVLALVLIYPGLRLFQLANPTTPVPWLSTTISVLTLLFVTRLMQQKLHNGLTRSFSAVVMTAIGCSFVTLCVLVPGELLLMSGLLDETVTLSGVITVTAVLCTYSLFNAQRLHVKTLNVPAHATAKGRRIVQISDLHLGSRQPGLLDRVVKLTNTQQPDFVVITGDLIDLHGISRQHLQPLSQLEVPVLFCIGNHERYVDLSDICDRLRAVGVIVLRNASWQQADLQFIGIDDAEARQQVARHLPAISPQDDCFRILLYHRPDGAEAAAQWGAHLMLTGHTHRGQIIPFNFLVKRVFPRLYRDFQIDGMVLYVSPGTGTWGPVMRLGSKCEITLIELV